MTGGTENVWEGISGRELSRHRTIIFTAISRLFSGLRDLWVHRNRGRSELWGASQTLRPRMDRRNYRRPRRSRKKSPRSPQKQDGEQVCFCPTLIPRRNSILFLAFFGKADFSGSTSLHYSTISPGNSELFPWFFMELWKCVHFDFFENSNWEMRLRDACSAQIVNKTKLIFSQLSNGNRRLLLTLLHF